MSSRNQHVTPHPDGGWQVKGAGAARATSRHPTQAEAAQRAKEIAENKNAERVIHDRHGRIREKNSYGNDPYPPRG